MISGRKTRPARPDRARLVLFAALAAGLLAALFAGLAFGYGRLRAAWIAQFAIADRDLDVVITTGKRVHPAAITLSFGLTNGANLAEIPFAEKRRHLLERLPNIRDIRIVRRLPQRVTVDVLEREPVARVVSSRLRNETGRVADAEGVVFRFAGDTGSLPVIREATDRPTVPGKRLAGRAAAALRLVQAAADADLGSLRVRQIDTSHSDYLLLTLSNQDRVKIAWDGMLDDTKAARDALARQLRNVGRALASELVPHPALWLATDLSTPGRVTYSPAGTR